MKIPAILDFSYFPFKKGIYKKGTEEFQALKEMSQSEDWALYIIEMKAKGIAINAMRLTEASKMDDQFVVNNLQSDEKEIDTGTLCEDEESSETDELGVEEIGKFHDKPADMEDVSENNNEELISLIENRIENVEDEEAFNALQSYIAENYSENIADFFNETFDPAIDTLENALHILDVQKEGMHVIDEAHVAGEIQMAAQKAKDENPGLKPEEINKKNTEQVPVKEDFRDRERNAGLGEEDGDREYYKKIANQYVKVGSSYMPLKAYSPGIGPTDGKIYIKRGGEYVNEKDIVKEGYRENSETGIKEDVQPTAPLQDFKGFDDVKPGDKATCYEKLGWTVLAKGTKQDWNELKQHDSGCMQGVIDGASEDEDFEMIAVEDPERGKAVFVYGNEGAVVPTISDSEQTEEENPQEAPAFDDHEVQENNPELPIDDENPIGDTLEGETAYVTDDNKPKLLDETMAPEIQQQAADARKANPNASPEEINKLNTSIKESLKMKSTDKEVIKEDNTDDKRIQSAFVVFANAKKALEQAQTELTINLGYHFTVLFQAQLTQANETIESARKQIEVIAKEARTKLKR